MDKKLVDLMIKITKEVHESIQSCNLPNRAGENKLFAPLVLLAQRSCDKILADRSKSILERLMLCAKCVEDFGAGNCMLQVFLTFERLLKEFIKLGYATENYCIPMSILTSKKHSFLLINNEIISDPWVNKVWVISEASSYISKAGLYFAIGENWDCYENPSEKDPYSYEFSRSLLVFGQGGESIRTHEGIEKKEGEEMEVKFELNRETDLNWSNNGL